MAKRWYVVRVQSGRENTVQTALERKLKVAGNVMLAQKLQAVLPAKAKL